MASDLEVRRLNLWIKSRSDKFLEKFTCEELLNAFQKLSPSEIKILDEKMLAKPKLVIKAYNRDDFRSPSAFRTSPSSSKSSDSESTGYRSTP